VSRWLPVGLALFTVLEGAEKKPAEGQASNDLVTITAKAYTDKQDVKQLLGTELEDTIMVFEVRLVPKPGKKLAVWRDDFELRSDKNGQRSKPFAPSQIAGSSVLVISSTGGGGGMASQGNGPVWGPPTGGRPRRIGGGDGAVVGNSGGPDSAVQTPGKVKESPLLELLEEKVLPEKEITEPLSGLLYFFLEGKHKPKDVELFYRGAAGTLSLRFKD
jgi:hypothetical protein